MTRRRVLASAAAVLALLAAVPVRAEEGVLGSVNTRFKVMGSDYIDVVFFDDPGIPGITCSLSRARTGGVTGLLGVATDSSKASVSCVQVGPVAADLAGLPSKEEVFKVHTSIFFKTTQVVRFVRPDRRLVTYLVYSDHLIDGSPENSVTSVGIR